MGRNRTSTLHTAYATKNENNPSISGHRTSESPRFAGLAAGGNDNECTLSPLRPTRRRPQQTPDVSRSGAWRMIQPVQFVPHLRGGENDRARRQAVNHAGIAPESSTQRWRARPARDPTIAYETPTSAMTAYLPDHKFSRWRAGHLDPHAAISCPSGGCPEFNLVPSGSILQPNFPEVGVVGVVFSKAVQPSSRAPSTAQANQQRGS